MSVIVKGMDFPHSCSECNLCLDNYCRQLKKLVGGYGEMNIHHPECPLERYESDDREEK